MTLLIRYMDSIDQIEHFVKILEQLSFDNFYKDGVRTINFQVIYDSNPVPGLVDLHEKIKVMMEGLVHKSDKILIQTKRFSKWYSTLNPFQLTNLKEYYLWNNDIDNFSFKSFFKYMPAGLKILQLFGNHITDLRGLALSESIERLHLSTNMIRSLEGVDFSKAKSLQLLDISMNRLVGFPETLVLPGSIQKLLINHNEIEEIYQGQFPDSLQHFSMAANHVSSLDHIRLPTSIIQLDLSDNDFVGFTDDFFSRCINMRKLNLEVNRIDDLDDLGHLPPNLEELILDYNEIDNYDFTNILNLTNLKKLSMEGTGLMSLRQIKFPDTLKVLNLKHNEINELIDVDFGESLESLDLSFNKLEVFRDDLKIPPTLRKLDLSENGFKDINSFQIPTSVTHLSFNMCNLRLNNKLLQQFPACLEHLELMRAIPKSVPKLDFTIFPQLGALYLQKNGIISLDKIDFPISVYRLDLSQNCIRQITNPTVLHRIRRLELRGNPIDNK
ncbi:hypothetical protein G210_4299 [Candida maltosa Xu316]|uniref:Uncharacterized protein n=1 Tax=Candida maltosa (strain Xu316) TaxID=1245528 RepID=M3J0Y6_CANMX|nr:hypothetical protein G210_4299 [Candida maltosa Xu316]